MKLLTVVFASRGSIYNLDLLSTFRSKSYEDSSADTKSHSRHHPGYGLQVSRQHIFDKSTDVLKYKHHTAVIACLSHDYSPCIHVYLTLLLTIIPSVSFFFSFFSRFSNAFCLLFSKPLVWKAIAVTWPLFEISNPI